MSANLKNINGDAVKVGVSTATVLSGDPYAVGSITGVAESDKDANNNIVLNRVGRYNLTVQAVDASGSGSADANSAVAIGDVIYIDVTRTPSGSISRLTKRSNGVKFGLALGTVSTGALTAIDVLLQN